ncbi:carboxymuconolactone decarboxylase family protein [Mycobacterium sp. ITM-2016-00317]|uniref:carboxymuconolactone decarboxylase family protein n=1 Tax=Mycobacterium sp. ITM-2016-00317 TaxID=2099694 RepID=UPI00287FDF66|nr:carboxymuconolactone decarboxylase family protein [Mycobacterium sp. ITM-2016-00317]WNG86664.1 carboxymuconolactone decarboxylase family protein [Mycobacterium sp. ITM-2016-00317]
MTGPRIQPLAPGQYPPEMRAALAALRPPNPRHPSLPTDDRPKALNVLGTLAHHPALAQAYFTFNGHLLLATTLSERQRELLVMRVAAVRKCGYEWAQHLFVARDAGLTDEEIGRIAYGPDAPFWTPLEAAMLRATDELIHEGAIGEPTWATLAGELDIQQLLDLIFTVCGYDTLARLFSSLELPLDGDIADLMRRYGELF